MVAVIQNLGFVGVRVAGKAELIVASRQTREETHHSTASQTTPKWIDDGSFVKWPIMAAPNIVDLKLSMFALSGMAFGSNTLILGITEHS